VKSHERSIAVVLFGFAGAIVVGVSVSVLASRSNLSGLIACMAAPLGAIGGVIIALLWKPSYYHRSPLKHCPKCGYDFRGLIGDHCPECGQRFRRSP